MGNTDSKQKLGERVRIARNKLDEDLQKQAERSEYFKSKTPKTMNVIIESIDKAFQNCSPFSEPALLVVWQSDREKCENIMLKACKKILKSPINKSEYEWFIQYVFPSSVWMLKTIENIYMYELLLDIAKNMSSNIVDSMDDIFKHLQIHSKWQELMSIKNKTIVSRQDDKMVGLLQEDGITDIRKISEMKDEKSDDIGIETFIDSHVAVTKLITTAKIINNEFQNHIKTVMSSYAIVASGPIKKFDRCQSKLENDYPDCQFPKAAKLLDLVRCSITFNTLTLLLIGYKGLMGHINKNPSIIQLARIKNGFLNSNHSGYRDIKVNVIYHSQLNIGVSMVVEIQFLLSQYLNEKKRIHKIYNILRQELYFQMVTNDENESKNNNNITNIKLNPILHFEKEIKRSCYPFTKPNMYRCCVDSELQLLAVEGDQWIGCIDMNTKKPIFEQEAMMLNWKCRHTSNWILINNEKYLSIKVAKAKIKMFKVRKQNDSYSLEEDKKYELDLGPRSCILYCEFDKDFQNIFLVVSGSILQKRAINNIKVVTKSIQLNNVNQEAYKQLSFSNDFKFCVLAAAAQHTYTIFVDIENNEITKLDSGNLKGTCAPCFINGERDLVAIGDGIGTVEIWDTNKKEVIKTFNYGTKRIGSITSRNNILAVGSHEEKKLRLYDVRTWNMFCTQTVDMRINSTHLTKDSKYLTVSGHEGEVCVVFEIQ